MTVIEALEYIEAAAQGNARLEALRIADEQCRDLRSVLFLALSPDVTFGVKKLPEVTNMSAGDSDEKWLHDTRTLLGKLRYRELTGNAAQEEIRDYLFFLNDTQKKWSERILRQDLRINLGAKDVNNVLGENTIYLFAVPLATDYAKVKEKDLKGKWTLQPKLDGGRCVAILHSDGHVELKSRTGKPWPNFKSIQTELENFNKYRAEEPNAETLYLDGEVVSLDENGKINFQQIQKTMRRQDGVEVGRLQFILFDVAVESDWIKPQAPYKERLARACRLADKYFDNTRIRVVETETVEDPTISQLKEACERFVGWGYEGAMLRKADEPVLNKRSKKLLKVKMFKDDEAKVIGVSELQREGAGADTLGALVCVGKNGVQFEIGSGFSAADRDLLWKSPPIGELVSYKYFEITNDGAPRFPIYRSLRHEDDVG